MILGISCLALSFESLRAATIALRHLPHPHYLHISLTLLRGKPLCLRVSVVYNGIIMLERRSAERSEVSVQMEIQKNGDVFTGTSVNVSEAGVFIETNKILQLGDAVTIRLVLEGQEDIVGTGEVVRDDDQGFGKQGYAVRWSLTDSQRQALLTVIRSSKK